MSEFLDDDIQPSIPQIPTEPQMNMPMGLNQSMNQLTPEMLDQIINDPNGHPEVRRSAKVTRDRLFPKEPKTILKEKVESKAKSVAQPKPWPVDKGGRNPPPTTPRQEIKCPPQKPKRVKKAKKTPKVKIIENKKIEQEVTELKSVAATSDDFTQFLSGMKKDLYQDEFTLLSDPGAVIQLKSMSVEEYKFLTKHLEMFEADTKDVKDRRNIERQELILTNALDTTLQRCIANNVDIMQLTVYDWLYLLLVLRCVSRPTESYFKISYKDKEKEPDRIKIDIVEILQRLRDNREAFVENPIGYVEIGDDLGLYLMIPTRGDMHHIESIFHRDPEATLSMLTLAMTIKAFVKGGKAFMMTPEQRIHLFNNLQYDDLKEIKKVYLANNDAFFGVINDYFQEAFGDVEALEVSDFILFFYDF